MKETIELKNGKFEIIYFRLGNLLFCKCEKLEILETGNSLLELRKIIIKKIKNDKSNNN